MTSDASSIGHAQQLKHLSLNHNMSTHVTVDKVTSKTAHRAGSYSGLHVCDPQGRYMFDDYTNELNKPGPQAA